MTLGFHIGDTLASSMRLHVGSPQAPEMPAMQVFGDILQPMIDQGFKLLDPTQFVIDATAARLYPKLPYVTVRACWLACLHFGIDQCLATVRTEHQSFYKRLFGHRLLCEARPYPGLSKPISLMSVNFNEIRSKVPLRYPFFNTSSAECQAVFGGGTYSEARG